MPYRTKVNFDIAEQFDNEIISLFNNTIEPVEDDISTHEKLLKVVRNIYLNELTPHQKQIYRMYYVENKNSVKIASELDITPQAVTKTLRGIRQKIRKYLILYK